MPCGRWRKIHDGPQVRGELIGGVVAVEAGCVDDAGHGTGARPGDHVHDDAVLFERLEDAEVGHAAGGPAAEGHANPNAAEVVDQPLQAVRQRPAPGPLRRHLAILKSRLARSRRFGTTGATGTAPSSSQATLILSRQPRAGTSRRCSRRTAASPAAAGTKNTARSTSSINRTALSASRSAWTSKMMRVGVLPLGHLLADLLGFQHPAIDAEGPEPHARPALATRPNR